MPAAAWPANEDDRLVALHSYQIMETGSEATFDNLARIAARLSDCPTALVALLDRDRQLYKGKYGMEADEVPRDVTFCGHAILDPSQALIVENATLDQRFADNPLVTGEPGVRFYVGLPLVNPEGFPLGTLCVIDYQPRQLDHESRELLACLAQAVMSTLELRRAAEGIRRLEQSTADRFQRVIERLPIALVLSRPSGEIVLINRAAEQMFGYARSEVEGRQCETLLPDRCRADHAAWRTQFLRNGGGRAVQEPRGLYGLRSDGSEFPLEIDIGRIDLGDGWSSLTTYLDISPRRRAEAQRDMHQRELEKSNTDLQQFAYSASHDLKAPLRAIGHLAEWIREDIQSIAQPDTLENLTLLQGRVFRLQALLDGLLAYSRIGHVDAVPENVDIGELVRDIVALQDVRPGFVVGCEGPMPVIATDRSPIYAVLKNLISNGLEHHDLDKGRVTVSMRLLAGMAEFCVADDGPGIDKLFHDSIFLAFHTLRSRDEKEASGLGLAIVKKAVEDHGGRIWVESAPPARGSKFYFTWTVSSE